MTHTHESLSDRETQPIPGESIYERTAGALRTFISWVRFKTRIVTHCERCDEMRIEAETQTWQNENMTQELSIVYKRMAELEEHVRWYAIRTYDKDATIRELQRKVTGL